MKNFSRFNGGALAALVAFAFVITGFWTMADAQTHDGYYHEGAWNDRDGYNNGVRGYYPENGFGYQGRYVPYPWSEYTGNSRFYPNGEEELEARTDVRGFYPGDTGDYSADEQGDEYYSYYDSGRVDDRNGYGYDREAPKAYYEGSGSRTYGAVTPGEQRDEYIYERYGHPGETRYYNPGDTPYNDPGYDRFDGGSSTGSPMYYGYESRYTPYPWSEYTGNSKYYPLGEEELEGRSDVRGYYPGDTGDYSVQE